MGSLILKLRSEKELYYENGKKVKRIDENVEYEYTADEEKKQYYVYPLSSDGIIREMDLFNGLD